MLLLVLSTALATVPLPRVGAEDPHQWLEEVHGEAALDQVRAWNQITESTFEADPRFADV